MNLVWYFLSSLGIFTFYIPFFTVGLQPLIYDKFGVNMDKVNLYNNNSLYNTIYCNYDNTIKNQLELDWINLNGFNKKISIINKLRNFSIEYVSVINICKCLKVDERNLEIISYDCHINNFKFVPNIMLSIFIILFGGGGGILIIAPIIMLLLIMKDIVNFYRNINNVKVNIIHSLDSVDSIEEQLPAYTK